MLGSVESTDFCAYCRRESDIASLDQIKVLFVLAPEILHTPVETFDGPGVDGSEIFVGLVPPSQNGSGVSYRFGKDQPPLEKGRYHVVCPFSSVDCYFDVVGAPRPTLHHARVTASEMQRPFKEAARAVINLEHGNAQVDFVAYVHSRSMCLGRQGTHTFDRDQGAVLLLRILSLSKGPPPSLKPKAFTKATELVHHPSLSRLLPEHAVHETFDVPDVTLVAASWDSTFTPKVSNGWMVRSTADGAVWAMDRVEAAVKVAEGLLRERRVRVGIYRGPATLVPLKGGMDYSGETMRRALRLCDYAKLGECCGPPELLEKFSVKREVSVHGVPHPVVGVR